MPSQEPIETTTVSDHYLEEKAFQSRTVPVFGAITDVSASKIVTRLLALDAESTQPITVLVSSPGGHVESGDAIHDIIRFVEAPVIMVGSGWVGSAAAHVFLGAERNRRFCLPNTRFLIHQPSGGAGGRATDVQIQAQEIIKVRERIAQVIARETGQPIERVRQDIDRDHWLSANQALEYGLLSKIIERQSDIDELRSTWEARRSSMP